MPISVTSAPTVIERRNFFIVRLISSCSSALRSDWIEGIGLRQRTWNTWCDKSVRAGAYRRVIPIARAAQAPWQRDPHQSVILVVLVRPGKQRRLGNLHALFRDSGLAGGCAALCGLQGTFPRRRPRKRYA